jgi:hypothetical protein
MIASHLLPALGLALLSALPAAAQNAVVLYGGVRGGGAFEQSVNSGPYTSTELASAAAAAASVDWVWDAARNAQVFLGSQRTTLALVSGSSGARTELPLSITYLQLGGTNYFDGRAGQGGYVAGGIGATLLAPKQDGLSSELRPSFSLAIGFEQPLSPALALRMELRGNATLINSSGGFFCSGGCVVVIRGDALVQVDALIGLSARF